MRSMTAYGRSVGQDGGKSYSCEIKSVNNRFLDVSVKLPRQYSFLEERVLAYIKSRISRGKVDVGISIEAKESKNVTVSLDKAYTDSYIAALKELKDGYGLYAPDGIPFTLVASNPNVFVTDKPSEDEEQDWAELLPFLTEAVDNYDRARVAEGERLKADLLSKRDNLKRITGIIKEKSEANSVGYKAKLEERLRKTLSDLDMTFSSDRILTEVAIFADKIAVDEELTRLGSHFVAFEDALNSDEPAGRKLDFLVQEMNREVNTTGSKSCDAEIAALVVEAKCEIEKIREQIQNLE